VSKIKLSKDFIRNTVKRALNEDLYPSGDITSSLVKNNHNASKDIKNLVSFAIKNKKGRKITVEVDNLKQLKTIIVLKFNTVLFDNMSIKNLKKGVKIAKKYYKTEASGNINLKTVKSIAATGVDRISVGSITHSAPAVDLKLEL